MNRLTHERCNGIKTGYWSPEKKDELVKALAAYENTGLTPDQIQELKERDTAKAPTEVDEYFGYIAAWRYMQVIGLKATNTV